MSINEVRVDGRIGKDGEVRFTASGACVVKFSIANTERKKQGDEWVDGETCWYDVEYWPKDQNETGRFVKGEYLCLKGRLKVDKWDAKDGTKHQKVKVVMREVESWEFVKGGQSQGQAQKGPVTAPVRTAPGNDRRAFEDDIPF